MKTTVLIAGALLIALGIAGALGLFQYTEHKQVLQVGDFKASVDEQRSVPQWLCFAGIVAGAALVAVGMRRA